MNFIYNTHLIEYEYNFGNFTNTLLLLHGWGGDKNSFVKIKNIFKCKYNILSISLPTINETILPLDLYTYRDIVLNLLKSLNVSSIYIICHSFGFRISLMLSSCINIQKIMVTGGAGIRLKTNFFRKLNISFRSIFLRSHHEYFPNFASSDYLNLSLINRQTFKKVVNKDLINHIKLLHCPIFLFWGDKDTATPIKILKIIKKIIPNCKFKIIKNGTHFCYLTNQETFIDCCDKFLNY